MANNLEMSIFMNYMLEIEYRFFPWRNSTYGRQRKKVDSWFPPDRFVKSLLGGFPTIDTLWSSHWFYENLKFSY